MDTKLYDMTFIGTDEQCDEIARYFGKMGIDLKVLMPAHEAIREVYVVGDDLASHQDARKMIEGMTGLRFVEQYEGHNAPGWVWVYTVTESKLYHRHRNIQAEMREANLDAKNKVDAGIWNAYVALGYLKGIAEGYLCEHAIDAFDTIDVENPATFRIRIDRHLLDVRSGSLFRVVGMYGTEADGAPDTYVELVDADADRETQVLMTNLHVLISEGKWFLI